MNFENYSEEVLHAFWFELMVKFERNESEELLTALNYIDHEIKKRADKSCCLKIK